MPDLFYAALAAAINSKPAPKPDPVRPVEVVTCWVCDGTGIDCTDTGARSCAACAGRGRIATEGGEA